MLWKRKKKLKKNNDISVSTLQALIHCNQLTIKQLGSDLVATIKLLNKTLLIISHMQGQIKILQSKKKVKPKCQKKK